MATTEELLAMPYAGGGAAIDADSYRIQYRQHGKAFRWWKAYHAEVGHVGPSGEVRERNGRVYVEQVLAPDVRCMVYQTNYDVVDETFGLIPKGSTGISVLPDECELARLDRVQLVDVLRLQRELVTRDGANVSLLHPPIEVLRVLADGAVVSPSAYALTANGLLWNEGAPAVGASIGVEYHYCPLWEYLPNEQGVVQRGQDGSALPQRGAIRALQAGESD